jgi:CRISPR/Cas system-associated exonuclease Cas4 (RecB family)
MAGTDKQILSRLIKNMNNREADPLRPVIDKYLLERDKPGANRVRSYKIDMKSRPRPGGRISPSSVGGCEREAVFKFVGARGRRRIDPDTELIFDDGNWRHHRWQATFRDMEAVLGKDVFEVVSIEGKARSRRLRTAGNFDAWVRIYGVDYIIDFKGANDAMHQRVSRDDAPLEKHVMQLLLYMKAKGVARGIIMYDNKNNQLTKNFAVSFDDAEWMETVLWIGRVLRKIETQKLPAKPPSCSSGNFQYERCPYARLCYGDMNTQQITDMVFKNFTSIEDLWQRGLDAEKAK